MRILICTKRDLHGCRFLNHLLPQLREHDVVEVWLSDKTRHDENHVPQLAELKLLERTLPFDVLFPLLNNTDDETELQTFAGLAHRYNIPIATVECASGDRAHRRLESLAPDLIISARFSYLFDRGAIDLARYGIVNVHPGRLPEYAGLFAPLRTINDGAAQLSCTVHWIDEDIDHGPLLAVIDQPLDRQHSLFAQIGTLYLQAIPFLSELVALCARGQRPVGTQQDFSRRQYRSLPDAEAFQLFNTKGIAWWHPQDYLQCLAPFTSRTAKGTDSRSIDDHHDLDRKTILFNKRR